VHLSCQRDGLGLAVVTIIPGVDGRATGVSTCK
jgi:hypothetical protein